MIASTLNNGCAASRENLLGGILVTIGAAASLNPASWAYRVSVTRGMEARLDPNHRIMSNATKPERSRVAIAPCRIPKP